MSRILNSSPEKPADWDDREYIEDPNAIKPEGYDSIPAEVPDPKAKKPDHWDEEEDGIWKPSKVPNPDGSARKLRTPIIKGNGRLLGLIIQMESILDSTYKPSQILEAANVRLMWMGSAMLLIEEMEHLLMYF